VATLLLLAAVAAAIVVPAVTAHSGRAQRVGIVGAASAPVRSALQEAAHEVGTDVTTRPIASPASAEQALRRSRIDLAVVGTRSVLVRTALSAGDDSATAQLARALAKTLGTVAAIDAAGLTPAQVRTLAGAAPLPVRGLQPATPPPADQGEAVTAAILTFLLLSQYLSWTLIGVMQEKANRVVEVLLAAIRPVELLAGKLLGIAAVVFLQAAALVAVALGIARAVGSTVLHGAGPLVILSQLLWIVLGYAFYSWLYAAAGSLAERQDQVQTLAIPLVVPLVFGYIVAISAAGSGHASTLLQVLGYLPPTAPFAAPVLVALGAMQWWQFLAAAAISVAGTLATARLAAAVYRRAILRTGRRVHLRELLRVDAATGRAAAQ
jgi:ABC-2 type transport system permease protein